MKKTILPILSVFLLASCMSSRPVSTYMVESVAETFPSSTPRISLRKLVVPTHLDTGQLVIRKSDVEIVVRRHEQWGVNFRRMIQDALSRELAKVPELPDGAAFTADIIFNRFEAQGKRLCVDAVVCICPQKKGEARSKRIAFELPWDGSSFPELASLHIDAIRRIAGDIAALTE